MNRLAALTEEQRAKLKDVIFQCEVEYGMLTLYGHKADIRSFVRHHPRVIEFREELRAPLAKKAAA